MSKVIGKRSGKVVLVTGCSSGFGKDLVHEFLRRGWKVIATLRKLESRRVLFRDDLAKYPQQLFLMDFDVTRSEQRKDLVRWVDEKFSGGLDCLVNNAGIGFFGALTDFQESEIREQMETNFFSAALLIRDLTPHLIRAQGRILNVSSVLGFTGLPFAGLYTASKFALEGLTECLYFELRPKGVQVGLIQPGGFRTNFAANTRWVAPADASSSFFEVDRQRFIAMREFLGSRPNPTPVDRVVHTMVRLAEAKKVPLRTQVGQDSKLAYYAKRLLPECIFFHFQALSLDKLMNKAVKKLIN